MGNRANAIVKHKEEQVCLYTHWNGSGLPDMIKKALVRGKGRWDDFQYLTRIIFCEMVDDLEGTTGFGITQVPWDGGADMTIYVDKQEVVDPDGNSYSFEEYIEQGDE